MRRATETNSPFRLVEREDIIAGVCVLMIEDVRRIDPGTDPRRYGTIVRLDENPVASNAFEDSELTVFYHCVEPIYWPMQCFVPIEDFCGERPVRSGPETRFWLPVSGEL